jgi:hypothetical protein
MAAGGAVVFFVIGMVIGRIGAPKR